MGLPRIHIIFTQTIQVHVEFMDSSLSLDSNLVRDLVLVAIGVKKVADLVWIQALNILPTFTTPTPLQFNLHHIRQLDWAAL